MTADGTPAHPSIRAIIFDMDNTLFDFVAAKKHACREVAKFLGRDDGEALFSCFLNSPHGFESHENIRDYFDLCGLLEACSTGKNPEGMDEGLGKSPVASTSPQQDTTRGISSPSRDNVVRIQVSQVSESPAKTKTSGSPPVDVHRDERRISVPSACAIPPGKGAAPRIPGVPGNLRSDIQAAGTTQPPLKAVRDNLLADKSLYCNEVFSLCCAIYEAEKVRVLEVYPGVRETLAELRRRGFPLAVLTDAHNGNALARLRKVELEGYFDHVISFDMTGAKKPAPDAFLLALDLLQTSPSETLLVGDSLRRDIAPAHALGMVTAYAKYGDRNVRTGDPPDCRPDYVLEDIRELANLV